MSLLFFSTVSHGLCWLQDPNQLIRASALRVLSSIRVPVIVPIVMLAIKDSATDMSPYVRKTAAHAIPKLYRWVCHRSLRKPDLQGVLYWLCNSRGNDSAHLSTRHKFTWTFFRKRLVFLLAAILSLNTLPILNWSSLSEEYRCVSLDPEQKDELIIVIEKLLSDRTTLVVGSAVMAFEEVSCTEQFNIYTSCVFYNLWIQI